MSIRLATEDCPGCGHHTRRSGDVRCVLCESGVDARSVEARAVIERALDRIRAGACEEEARELWSQIDRAEVVLSSASDA